MDKFLGLLRAFNQDNDALAEHRHSIVKHLCLFASLLLLGISALHISNRDWALVALNSLACAVLGWTCLRMWHGGRPPIPMTWLAGFMVCILLMSVHLQGVAGVLWSYPFLFVCYFALPRRTASWFSLLLVVGVVTLAWPKLGPGMALRVLVSQTFVMVMVNLVLSVIGDLQRALRTQAITDPLTGAFNRRHLQAHIEAAVGTPGHALLAIDLDHFKRINDRYGHDVGDEVLCRLVTVLNAALAEDELLFRTGGEEFMLLLPAVGLQAALQKAEALRQHLAASRLLGGEAITVSIGVAVLLPGQDARHWLKRADTALYQAKHRGRDCVLAA